MTEPNTLNKALIVPNTGDLPGAWGTAALNPNFSAIDGMLGGFATISLSGATTIALSAPAGTVTPGAGPNQQQNAMLRFTGTQTGNAVIQFSIPGFFIIDNQCTGGTTITAPFIQLTGPSGGTGTFIAVPPGMKSHVFFDGTNVDFVNPPLPGTPIDLHGATQVPSWMFNCSRAWALIKDGTVYTSSIYPQLSAMLGSTFGGNGVTTFGVPDERSRMRLALDPSGANRVTTGGSGIAGNTMGAAGGNELMQSHTHANTLTDPGHTHTTSAAFLAPGSGTQVGGGAAQVGATIGTSTTGVTINNVAAGSGGSQNMPPTIVSFLALIKT